MLASLHSHCAALLLSVQVNNYSVTSLFQFGAQHTAAVCTLAMLCYAALPCATCIACENIVPVVLTADAAGAV